MRRDKPFVPGEIYHLYARGIEKREVFLTDFEYKRFQLSLFLANDKHGKVHMPNTLKYYTSDNHIQWEAIYKDYKRSDPLVDILAYTLMPNHFHLLVKERPHEKSGVSEFMRKIITGYAQYFNLAHERKGPLFEGAFKSKHVDDEPYFRWLFSYIHLNPVKLIDPAWKNRTVNNISKVQDFLNTYTYSSYLDYAGAERSEKAVISPSLLPEYFSPATDAEGLLLERSRNQDLLL